MIKRNFVYTLLFEFPVSSVRLYLSTLAGLRQTHKLERALLPLLPDAVVNDINVMHALEGTRMHRTTCLAVLRTASECIFISVGVALLVMVAIPLWIYLVLTSSYPIQSLMGSIALVQGYRLIASVNSTWKSFNCIEEDPVLSRRAQRIIWLLPEETRVEFAGAFARLAYEMGERGYQKRQINFCIEFQLLWYFVCRFYGVVLELIRALRGK